MAAAAHNPAFAKKVGIPVSVAQEFNRADQRVHKAGGGPLWTAARLQRGQLMPKMRRLPSHKGEDPWQKVPHEMRRELQALMNEEIPPARVAMRVMPENVEDIIRSGELRNQFETGSSMGHYDPEDRAIAERALFGIPYIEGMGGRVPGQPQAFKQRPKYGYLTPETEALRDPHQNVNSYGPIKLLFDESVKPRTTFTVADSLGGGMRPAPMLKPSITAMPPSFITSRYASDYGAPRIPKSMWKDPAGFYPGYIEAQMHGPLPLSSVRGATVNPEIARYAREETQRAMDMLKEYGIDTFAGGGSVQRAHKAGGGPLVKYHVTLKKHLDRIRKQGLRPMQTSNWVHQGDPSKRQGAGEIYAFEHPEDATRWAGRMDWELNKKFGSGDISILGLRPSPKDKWLVDEADPLSQAGAKGKWWKQMQHVGPEYIGEDTPFTAEMLKGWKGYAGGGSVSGPLARVMQNIARPIPTTRRVAEEMFDRIPGLEKQFSEETLAEMARRAGSGDVIPMVYKPESFERLALPLGGEGGPAKYQQENIEKLRGLIRGGTPFNQPVYMHMREVNPVRESGYAPLVTTGHEGRHRSRAMAAEGIPNSLMWVHPGWSGRFDEVRKALRTATPETRILSQKVGDMPRDYKPEAGELMRWSIPYGDVFEGKPILGRKAGGTVSPLKQLQKPKARPLDRSQMMAQQIVRQQSLQDPKQKLTGFARGGNVHRQRIPRRGVHGYQGGGIIKSPLAMMKQGINMVARPWQRSFAKPVMGAEASVSGTTSPVDMPARYAQARQGLQGKSPLADLPYEQGMGAWQGEQGLQTNPLFMTEMPRTLGRVSDEGESLKYAGAMGKSLNQFGVPVSRATKSVFNIPEGADSVILSGVKDDDIPRLAEAVGQDAVVSQRPKGEVLIFSLTGEPINEVAKKVKLVVPNAKLNFGVSKPDVDRVLVAQQKMGPGTKTYDEVGAEDLLRASEEDVAGSMEGAM
jgi:hypothetical protein